MSDDWINDFVASTAHRRSPDSFRLWAGITTISAILERRVWTETDVDRLYPNLYVLLGGLPGSGKTTMISFSKRLLSTVPGVHFGPDEPSREVFWDKVEGSAKQAINGMGVAMYSAMYVPAGEWGDFMSKYDTAFASNLSTIYDNPDNFDMPRRTSKNTFLEAPTLNILGGVTPAALGDIIPESAWGQGFTSRVIFVYGVRPEYHREMFRKVGQKHNFGTLEARLLVYYNEYHGEIEWEPEAQEAFGHWYNDEKMAPVPTYARLFNYTARRDTQVTKLSMISAVSAGRFPYVTLADFIRGRTWLLEAEKTMPDIFRAMSQKSDEQIIQDLYNWMYGKYMGMDRDKRVAIKEQELWRFMENKAASDKIPKIIQAAERMGYIRRGPGFGTWVPGEIKHEEMIGDIENPDQPYKNYLEEQGIAIPEGFGKS